MWSLSACHSARSKSEIRGVKTPLICLSFLRELRRVIIAIICLINDKGIYPTFSGFALASSYVIFSVRSLFKSYFLGVRSEFNTHNPAICQAYFFHYLTKTSPLENFHTLPKPYHFIALKKYDTLGNLRVLSLEKKPCTLVKP